MPLASNDVIAPCRFGSKLCNWLTEADSRRALLRYQFHSSKGWKETCACVCGCDHSPLRHWGRAIRAVSIIQSQTLPAGMLPNGSFLSHARTHNEISLQCTRSNMHVIKHAHTHRHTNTQRMGVGRVEMGVVSLLLPDCCHGDADGAFTAGWDSHFAIKMHTHGHAL